MLVQLGQVGQVQGFNENLIASASIDWNRSFSFHTTGSGGRSEPFP